MKTESSGIYHVIYSSSAVMRLSQRQLLELLTIARQKNEKCGLSGMLLYRDGLYLQFLEGPRNEVESLLNRLRQDGRHKSIRILREGTLPGRLFPDWSMAYKNLAGLRSSQTPGYSERLQASFSAEEEDTEPARMLTEIFQGLLVRG